MSMYAHLLPGDHDRARSVVQAACVGSLGRVGQAEAGAEAARNS